MLIVNNVSKKFQRDEVVQNITFHLKKGACTALLGPNGAGKTTILRMLTGLIKPTTGTIIYPSFKQDYRYHIGYLPQYPQFYRWMTGEEFLIYSCKLYYLSKKEAHIRTEALLKKVNLFDAKDAPIRTYSGGMKQRLGIAQALIHQPDILLLDEPVSSLDPIGRRDLLTLIQSLKDKMTILFSTHILNDAEEISDSVIVLKDGQIVEQGTIQELEKKYTTSKIIIRSHQLTDQIIELLRRLPSITSLKQNGQEIHMYVTDLQKAQEDILQFILEKKLRLEEFRLGRVSMEEIFMKAVN